MKDFLEDKTSDIMYEWQQPKAHSLWTSNVMLKDWKGKFFRTVLITAVIELAFYFLLQPFPLEEIEFNLNKALLSLFLFALGMSAYAYLVGPYLMRFDVVKCKVDSKGIRTKSFSGNRLHPWKNIIRCCPVENHEFLESVICINFYIKQYKNRPRTLIFDRTQKDLADKVYNYILSKSANLIQAPLKTKPRIKLDRWEHLYMAILSLIGSLGFIFLIIPELKNSNLDKDFQPLIFLLLVILLGPGTWGMFLLYGKNIFKYQNWSGWMVFYNFITLNLIVMITVIQAVNELSKAFK